MIKNIQLFFTTVLLCINFHINSQEKPSVNKIKVDSLITLSGQLHNDDLDRSMVVAQAAVKLADSIGYKLGKALALDRLGYTMDRKSNYAKALEYYLQSLAIKKEADDLSYSWTSSEIGYIYNQLGEIDEALRYYEQGIEFAKKHKIIRDIGVGKQRVAGLYRRKGDLQKSMELFEEGLAIGVNLNDNFIISVCAYNIAGIYVQLNNHTKALSFIQQSLIAATAQNDNRLVSDCYTLKGRIYRENKDYKKAEEEFIHALDVSISIEHKPTILKAYVNLGDVKMDVNELGKALENYEKAYKLSIEMKIISDEALTLCKIASVYLIKKDFDKSIKLSSKALDLAKGSEDLYYKIYASELLWKANKAQKNYKNALRYNEQYNSLQKDASSSDLEKALVKRDMQFKIERDSIRYLKEQAFLKSEQEKKDIKQRSILYSTSAILTATLAFLFIVYRQRNRISLEKKKSEDLLLNILPSETAEELKRTGTTKAKDFENVTVLFTDFKNFTLLSESLSAQELVNEINHYYSAFDKIIAKYHIEKIKTIGDAYMCAGGLPVPNPDNAEGVVRAALEIRDFILEEKQKRIEESKPFFEIRIGCHTGPVVAGIVGVKKFAYDIWGDTVNIASRMESSGMTNKVNISNTTYELVKDKFLFEARGKIKAKNKGEIDMYFVEN